MKQVRNIPFWLSTNWPNCGTICSRVLAYPDLYVRCSGCSPDYVLQNIIILWLSKYVAAPGYPVPTHHPHPPTHKYPETHTHAHPHSRHPNAETRRTPTHQQTHKQLPHTDTYTRQNFQRVAPTCNTEFSKKCYHKQYMYIKIRNQSIRVTGRGGV
jgi:hypothetical protein